MVKPARSKDWKQWKAKGWKYKRDAPYDEEWKKDRSELFNKHGNGWWWFSKSVVYANAKQLYADEIQEG